MPHQQDENLEIEEKLQARDDIDHESSTSVSLAPDPSGFANEKLPTNHNVDVEEVSTPSFAVSAPQKWNQPQINKFRLLAAFWGFLINGAHDAAFGPLIPYLETYYNLSYTVVSLLFVSPFVGYLVAAIVNNRMSHRFGRRGAATIAPITRLIPYIIIAVHPPFPVIVVILMFAGFGSCFQDASWNAWIGTMSNANQLLGFLHGFYGLGALLAPLIATSMVAKYHRPWYEFYYVMIGASCFELLIAAPAFWSETGAKFRQMHADSGGIDGKSSTKEALFTRPAARVTWLCAFFLLGYVGVEVALGGWIVTFMINIRNAEAFASGMTATGFWLGLTVGRFILGFITPKIGERTAITIYLPLTIGFQILFWTVPSFYASTISVAFEGFFLGPIFPAAVVAVARLLPKRLHISAISTAAALGKCGGSIFPFAVGAIAQAKGVQVLQPIILALLVVVLVLWLCLPRIKKQQEALADDS
ncbi:putative MFS transporter [Tothia fuscella]|uniref:MFS transporter n=1 Tax=Tothia fuscella TaxID=1048955 RepID=A0A9P4NHL2_9PEZI|nr:putative MFS transporter [Tothia fuscella]